MFGRDNRTTTIRKIVWIALIPNRATGLIHWSQTAPHVTFCRTAKVRHPFDKPPRRRFMESGTTFVRKILRTYRSYRLKRSITLVKAITSAIDPQERAGTVA
jgi:hypothetical protein